MGMKDILTGLDQYEVFLEKLQKEIDQIGDDRIIIVYTDIKHFKYINDTYGYKVGDALLQDFVEIALRALMVAFPPSAYPRHIVGG